MHAFAADAAFASLFQRLIAGDRKLANIPDLDGRTPIALACGACRRAGADYSQRHGAPRHSLRGAFLTTRCQRSVSDGATHVTSSRVRIVGPSDGSACGGLGCSECSDALLAALLAPPAAVLLSS